MRSIQGAEVEYVGMRVRCANDLLALRRAGRIRSCAPERGCGSVCLLSASDCISCDAIHTKNDLYMAKQVVSYPGCYDACCGCKDTNRPGPSPGALVSKRSTPNDCTEAQTCCCGCCCFFIVKMLCSLAPLPFRRTRRLPTGATWLRPNARTHPRCTCRQDQARPCLPVVSSPHPCVKLCTLTNKSSLTTSPVTFFFSCYSLHGERIVLFDSASRLRTTTRTLTSRVTLYLTTNTTLHQNG